MLYLLFGSCDVWFILGGLLMDDKIFNEFLIFNDWVKERVLELFYICLREKMWLYMFNLMIFRWKIKRVVLS